MPGEHELRIALATALRERDEAWSKDSIKTREINILTKENRDLRAALELYRNCRHACQECFCVKEARAALATGGDRG